MYKPSNMKSQDIWRHIMGHSILPGSFSINEERIIAAIKKERFARRMDMVGEYCGIFIVLAIYAGIFCLISRLFTHMTYFQCLGISIGIYCVSKIFTIPIIRFMKKSIKETMNG